MGWRTFLTLLETSALGLCTQRHSSEKTVSNVFVNPESEHSHREAVKPVVVEIIQVVIVLSCGEKRLKIRFFSWLLHLIHKCTVFFGP